ncbi:glycosyltransferase family 2 protein [Desulfatiferula olefinivorans]
MISVVVPIYDEKDNLPPLINEIASVMDDVPIDEIIVIDDGSTDGSWDVLQALRARHPALRTIRHTKNYGQSAALWTGIEAASRDIIVTLDGDGQNPPEDIRVLWEAYTRNKITSPRLMVAGERTRRNDNRIRRISSKIANGIRSSLLHDHTRDTGCSLKLFRRSDFLRLPYFDHMHRFLPALMLREGVRLVHVGVSHRPRVFGHSKYGTLDRALVGLSDLFGVLWLQKRAHRPLKIDSMDQSIGEAP